METTYLTTRSFLKSTDNVVDFQEYKRKKQAMEEPSLYEEWAEHPVLSQEKTEPPASLLRQIGDCLDAVASLALTLSALAAILLLL